MIFPSVSFELSCTNGGEIMADSEVLTLGRCFTFQFVCTVNGDDLFSDQWLRTRVMDNPPNSDVLKSIAKSAMPIVPVGYKCKFMELSIDLRRKDIKSLRLPMKLGGHRGFAFVEYVTKQEAQNALQALSSTHLYGRHLVLEQAKAGESLEELRARTAAQFVDEHNGFRNLSNKRKNFNILDEATVKFARIVE
ncbi:hypothetical protein HPP92_002018 [Vanilla planifolia]|uniref:RRM domain-containing protein n=1 Tax=Vanilla planifolia TaxID=51239 RepID=A0A835S8W9_VANPL|nr:hypothetical protein HPP92_002018 [Vanilla planifolia]